MLRRYCVLTVSYKHAQFVFTYSKFPHPWAQVWCKFSLALHARIQKWTGGPDPLKIKEYSFFINTGPDPMKVTKLPSQHSMWGHYRHAREMAYRWLADDDPLLVLYGSFSPHHQKKVLSELDPLWQNFLEPRMVYMVYVHRYFSRVSMQQGRSISILASADLLFF